jgi:tetratricopeptide (TPR) repeat protein
MQYEAFISYSHSDEKWASWIHRALEGFRIPKRLVAELGLSTNRFLPVFRDFSREKDELASSSDLSDTLLAALRGSGCLIVVCSPASASSRWVNEEVAAFQELGRAERVFCIIVDGDPADPESCFPAGLRGTGSLAIDLRRGGDGRRRMRLRLAASVLGIGFDRLRQRDTQRRRKHLLNQLLVTSASALIIATLSCRFAVTPPCQDSQARMAAVWSPEIQQAIERVFITADVPYAADVWGRLRRRIDGYRDSWISMHRDTCEATMVREEQSSELLDLRMACLNERRTEFAGLIDSFQHADAQLVERAIDATSELRGLTRCADRTQLLVAFPLPEDATQRQAIKALREDLAVARSRLAAGELTQVRDAVPSYVALSEQVEYPSLQAESLLLRGAVEQQSGRSALAREALYAAAAKAVLARENELVARTWIALAQLFVEQEGDAREALSVLQLAQSYIAQLSSGHPLEARFHEARARALTLAGDYQQVAKDIQVAVDISRAADHATLSLYLSRLSTALVQLHRLDEAQAVANEAIVRAEETFGRHHPSYAAALVGAASVATMRGNHSEALRLRQRVLEITQQAYSPGHPRLVTALERLAWSLKETGRFDEAIATAERALALELGFEAPRLGVLSQVHNTLGDVYVSVGDYPMALEALEAVLEMVRRSGDKPGVGLALNNLGNTANRAGDHGAAVAYCRDALAVDETHLVTDHPDLGYSLSCIGEALLGAGNPRQALVPLARAHGVRDRLDIVEGSLAWTRWLYGRALWESGSDKRLGLIYVRFAERIFLEMGASAGSERADVVNWLGQRGLATAAVVPHA